MGVGGVSGVVCVDLVGGCADGLGWGLCVSGGDWWIQGGAVQGDFGGYPVGDACGGLVGSCWGVRWGLYRWTLLGDFGGIQWEMHVGVWWGSCGGVWWGLYRWTWWGVLCVRMWIWWGFMCLDIVGGVWT